MDTNQFVTNINPLIHFKIILAIITIIIIQKMVIVNLIYLQIFLYQKN